MRQKLGRNEPCGCDSGKKYKAGCLPRGLKYNVDEQGGLSREVVITDPETIEAMKVQRDFAAAETAAGRNPEGLLFPGAPPAEHIEAHIAAVMRKAEFNPALIYAFERTSRLVTDENIHLLSEKDLAEWNEAVEEYYAMHPDAPRS